MTEAGVDAPLTRNRSFLGFVGAQFLGAFNDNLYKQIVLLLAAGTLFPGEDKQGLAFAVFSIPFVLLGGIAGEVSERYSKSRIMVVMKVLEIGILTLGMGALALMSWAAMLGVLFLMGVHSAFFGPCKYGGMPEMVGETRLLSANALVAMTTFLAVLLGGALPGPLMDRLCTAHVAGGACPAWCSRCSGCCSRCASGPLPAMRPELRIGLNPFAGLGDTLRSLRERPALFAVVIGMSLFWFNGGVLNQSINGLAGAAWLDIPEGEKSRISWLLMAQSVSIIAGSLLVRAAGPPVCAFAGRAGRGDGHGRRAGRIAGDRAAARAGDGAYAFAVGCLLCTGFFGAIFFVPVNAYLQAAIEAGGRGRAFAANNFLNFLFIFLSGAWYLVLRGTAPPAADLVHRGRRARDAGLPGEAVPPPEVHRVQTRMSRAPIAVEFVCLGNICRSPLAEGLFRHHVDQAGLGDRFVIASAGTGGWHVGDPPDTRSIAVARRHGVDISAQRGRQLTAAHLDIYDEILAMDAANLATIRRHERSGSGRGSGLLLDELPDFHVREVPDPYSGCDADFEEVFRMVDARLRGAAAAFDAGLRRRDAAA